MSWLIRIEKDHCFWRGKEFKKKNKKFHTCSHIMNEDLFCTKENCPVKVT